jgi:hypothetical protein
LLHRVGGWVISDWVPVRETPVVRGRSGLFPIRPLISGRGGI